MCLKKYPGLNQSGGKLKRKYKHNTLLSQIYYWWNINVCQFLKGKSNTLKLTFKMSKIE